jgi:hypothetical protein
MSKKLKRSVHNEALLESAKSAVDELMCDKSVGLYLALENMQQLQSIVDSHVDGLEYDIRLDLAKTKPDPKRIAGSSRRTQS